MNHKVQIRKFNPLNVEVVYVLSIIKILFTLLYKGNYLRPLENLFNILFKTISNKYKDVEY